MSTLPFQFLVATLTGWVNCGQQDVMECLQEENRVLRKHLGGRRLFTGGVKVRDCSGEAGLQATNLGGPSG
jgi:hypothetical protein